MDLSCGECRPRNTLKSNQNKNLLATKPFDSNLFCSLYCISKPVHVIHMCLVLSPLDPTLTWVNKYEQWHVTSTTDNSDHGLGGGAKVVWE